MSDKHIANLKNSLDTLKLSAEWLKRSYEQCVAISIKETYTKDEFDKFENLTSRYARTTDMLVNQVLRGLDAVEMLNHGTIIDIMNRAEKRGIVPAADVLRDLKDLRNEIAHEYQTIKIEQFFDLVLKSTPILFSIIDNTFDYARQYISDVY
jgi:uncharacterized protein YutE (UPF0331/DUF86 family)